MSGNVLNGGEREPWQMPNMMMRELLSVRLSMMDADQGGAVAGKI
jgi:hypothetical protein